MQYLTQYMVMLKVADLIGKMPVGEGWTLARDFVLWTNLSRPTVYRYLKNLSRQEILDVKEHKVGKRVYREYRLSKKGKELYNSQKTIFNWE